MFVHGGRAILPLLAPPLLRRQTSSSSDVHLCVVGGGILGCATAMNLRRRYPHKSVTLVEKEDGLARHQSGRNSGVIHAGIYYATGSLRAKLCVSGMQMMYDYCDENNIAYKKCGKLIIATTPAEVHRLRGLLKRAMDNGCRDVHIIEGGEIHKYEPLCQGLMAIVSPHTGIVDFGEVTRSFASTFRIAGGQIDTQFEVRRLETVEGGMRVLATDGRSLTAKHVITCAGLQADRVSALTGCSPSPRIVPFRGEYLQLKDPSKVHMNVYPVPDPRFPFLGVHFTPRINGDVWLGPNAVLAMAREGYSWDTFNLNDLIDALSFRGMHRLMCRNMMFGLSEVYRSFNKAAQVRHAQRFMPSITADDVIEGPCGVRAQAVSEEGDLVEDFVFDSGEGEAMRARVLHVRNAPSPAATSSLAIAALIVEKAAENFTLVD